MPPLCRDILLGALFSTWMVTLFLFHNSYPVLRPEVALLCSLPAAVFAAILTACRLGRADWLGFALIAIMLLDYLTGYLSYGLLAAKNAAGLAGISGPILFLMKRVFVLASVAPILFAVYLVRKNLSGLMAIVFSWLIAFNWAAAAFFGEPLVSRRSWTRAPADLPNVYFIVLDSHPAIGAIPEAEPRAKEVKSSLRGLLLNNGFTVFENAFSNASATRCSMPSIFNDAAPDPSGACFYQEKLTTSKILDSLVSKGYALDVRETTYFDYCEAAPAGMRECTKVSANSVGFIASHGIPVRRRAALLAGAFFFRPSFAESGRPSRRT